MTTYTSDAVDSGIMPDFSKAGVVMCRSGSYTATADIESGTFQMVPVPENCLVLDTQFDVTGNASQGAFDVGDGSSAGRFFNGVNMSLVPVNLCGGYGASGGMNKEYTANDTVDVVISGSDLASGSVMKLNVWYKMLGTLTDES
jgi:hypothetical protein